MGAARGLTLLCGVVSAAMGGVLILLRGVVEGAVWLGVLIAVGGFVLIGLALASARREPGPDEMAVPSAAVPRRPGLWFPVGIVLILLLQVVYLIWWANVSRK